MLKESIESSLVHMLICFVFLLGSVVTANTISSPWTPVAGPPAETNGAGPDTKNLDVGDVSDVSFIFFFTNKSYSTIRIVKNDKNVVQITRDS